MVFTTWNIFSLTRQYDHSTEKQLLDDLLNLWDHEQLSAHGFHVSNVNTSNNSVSGNHHDYE